MSRFEKWSVWITSALTVITGLGYFVTKYLVAPPDPYAVVNHPWQPYFLKVHVLVSPLLLFALGTIAVHHIWEHYVTGVEVSRRSAIVTALAVIPMVLTGYLIQVLTDEGWVRAMAISHIVFGCLYGAGLAAHSWIIRWKNGDAVEAGEAGEAGAAGTPGGEADDGAGDSAPGPGAGPERPSRSREGPPTVDEGASSSAPTAAGPPGTRASRADDRRRSAFGASSRGQGRG